MSVFEFFIKDITTVFVILLLIFFLFLLIFLVVKFLTPRPVSEEESEKATEGIVEPVAPSVDVPVVEAYLKDIISTLDELKTKIDTLAGKLTGQQNLSEEIKSINSKLDTIYRILSDISEG